MKAYWKIPLGLLCILLFPLIVLYIIGDMAWETIEDDFLKPRRRRKK